MRVGTSNSVPSCLCGVEAIDARRDDAYRAINPNGQVSALALPDGVALSQANAVPRHTRLSQKEVVSLAPDRKVWLWKSIAGRDSLVATSTRLSGQVFNRNTLPPPSAIRTTSLSKRRGSQWFGWVLARSRHASRIPGSWPVTQPCYWTSTRCQCSDGRSCRWQGPEGGERRFWR